MEEGYVKISQVIFGRSAPLVVLPATEIADAVYSHALWADEGYYHAESLDDSATYYIDGHGKVEW